MSQMCSESRQDLNIILGRVLEILWVKNNQLEVPNVFAILDGARDRRIEPMLRNSGSEHECLFSGQMTYALRRAAPFIVKLEKDSDFIERLLSLSWGNAWGVLGIANADCTLQTVRKNLRSIARVIGPNGKPLMFRYYDPRVMRVYLPTCVEHEVTQVFGPLQAIVMEDVDSNKALKFTPGSDRPIQLTSFDLAR